MNAVDVHAHVIVPELLRDAAPAERWRPDVTVAADGQRVELGGTTIASAVDEFVDVDAILASLSRREVDRVVLSPWVPLLFYGVEAEEGLERCRMQNAGLARLHRRQPARVRVFGAVPLQDPELAAAEVPRVMARDGFAGVEVTASVNGVYLGDARFEPFWSAAEQCDALIFVHPTTRGLDLPVLREHYLWNLVGNPVETTIAAAHLILSGTMARHPDLRVLLAHGGGAIVALRGRLRHGQHRVPAAAAESEPAADEMTRRFLFDTVTHDPWLLRTLVEAVGSERVLLGSDHPFDMADPRPVATVRAAGLGAEAEHAVLAGNAARELCPRAAVRA